MTSRKEAYGLTEARLDRQCADEVRSHGDEHGDRDRDLESDEAHALLELGGRDDLVGRAGVRVVVGRHSAALPLKWGYTKLEMYPEQILIRG